MDTAVRRDIVVVGASAGGVEALSAFVARLPRDLAASVFVVLHVPPGIRSRLPEILSRRGPLGVRHARDGERIQHGSVLVAPPDLHLVVRDNRVHLVHGPRQNSSRPAIDALFRSAAEAMGPRVVGVVLSGYLDDGAEGLREIMRAGGEGFAQDPKEALVAEMPENAAARSGARVATVAEIANAVVQMATGERVYERVKIVAESNGDLEPERPDVQIGATDAPGVPTGLTCPECHGVLWIGPDANAGILHCRVGHTYSIETLQEEQRTNVEKALWAAVRSLREHAAVAAHIASRAEARGTDVVSMKYRERERMAIGHAQTLERMLLEGDPEEAEA